MRHYETLYLINPNISEEDYRAVITKFNDLVEKNRGVLIRVDEWGRKSLAYQVKKLEHAFYVLLQYCSETELLEELKRNFRLDDRVLKFQTVKLNDNPDVEALRIQAQETQEKASEKPETTEEANSQEEGENGLQ